MFSFNVNSKLQNYIFLTDGLGLARLSGERPRQSSIRLTADWLADVKSGMVFFLFCLWTIVNLCLRKENRSVLEKARCLSTVASAIDNHPRCNPVKMAAQSALQHLLEIMNPKYE